MRVGRRQRRPCCWPSAAAQPTRRSARRPRRRPHRQEATPRKTPARRREQEAGPTPGAYASMPIAERAAIQFDLNWTNHYHRAGRRRVQRPLGRGGEGVPEGPRLPRDRRARPTASARRSRPRRRTGASASAGAWSRIAPPARRSALPTKLATHESSVRSGTRWQSAQGQFQIETFRIREPGATLATVFEDQKKEPPNRRIATSALRNGSFVLTGMQGLKNFLVRAEIRDLEIRGITVLYDQAIEGTTDLCRARRARARSRRSPAPA